MITEKKPDSEQLVGMLGKIAEEMRDSNKAIHESIGELRTKYDAIMTDLEKDEKERADKNLSRNTDFISGGGSSECKFVDKLPVSAHLGDSGVVFYPTRTGYGLVNQDMARKMDDLYLVSALMAYKGIPKPITELGLYQDDTELRKALTAAGSGTGLEWVPTGYSSEMTDLIRLELKVAALFGRINMPTNPYVLPRLAGGLTPRYLSGEATAPVTADIVTANKTYTAKKLAAQTSASYEVSEDSIVPVIPILRREIVRALAMAQEQACLNGDDSGTHMDTDHEAGAATLVEKAFKGLRMRALNASYANCKQDGSTTFDELDFHLLRKAMGVNGVNNDDMAIICSIAGYFHILGFANLRTVDKMGPGAVILKGQVAELEGIPVVVSEHQRDDVDATGVNGASANDFTTVLLVKRGNHWLWGDRRDVLVETDRDIQTQEDILVASERVYFDTPYADTAKLVGAIYNISN